jgi:hypothetical protein
MNDSTLWKVWKCSNRAHAQPCWHGRCKCGFATAFDFSAEDVRWMLASHGCPLA